jgi:hypothetical protein
VCTAECISSKKACRGHSFQTQNWHTIPSEGVFGPDFIEQGGSLSACFLVNDNAVQIKAAPNFIHILPNQLETCQMPFERSLKTYDSAVKVS